MNRVTRGRLGEHGLTLVELTIALAILSIGVLAVAVMQLGSSHSNTAGNTATQRYICGTTAFNAVHQAASSNHSGGVNVGLADGSVRFIRDTVDFVQWQGIGSRANGEVVQVP